MGRFSMRVPLSLFWPLSSSKVVYKINKGANLHPWQVVYENNSIPQQPSHISENFGGNNVKQGHCDLPVTEYRICYKPKEISSSPNTENRVLGNDNRLSGDGSVAASGENRVDFQKVIVSYYPHYNPDKSFAPSRGRTRPKTPPAPSRHINNSLGMYLHLRINNRLCTNIFFNRQYKCAAGESVLKFQHQKQRVLYSAAPSFSKNISNPRSKSTKIVHIPSVNIIHLSGLNSRINPFKFL